MSSEILKTIIEKIVDELLPNFLNAAKSIIIWLYTSHMLFWGLILLLLIAFWINTYKRNRKKTYKDIESILPWTKYKRDKIGNMIYSWEYSISYTHFRVINIKTLCPDCKCRIISMNCPNCHKGYHYSDFKSEEEVRAIVEIRIDKIREIA